MPPLPSIKRSEPYPPEPCMPVLRFFNFDIVYADNVDLDSYGSIVNAHEIQFTLMRRTGLVADNSKYIRRFSSDKIR